MTDELEMIKDLETDYVSNEQPEQVVKYFYDVFEGKINTETRIELLEASFFKHEKDEEEIRLYILDKYKKYIDEVYQNYMDWFDNEDNEEERCLSCIFLNRQCRHPVVVSGEEDEEFILEKLCNHAKNKTPFWMKIVAYVDNKK